jgi:acyl carrier protein
MNELDALRELLVEFFELPAETPVDELNQRSIDKWDSLAMVHLITELQTTFAVEFELDEIEHLTSYMEIRLSLVRKGVEL